MRDSQEELNRLKELQTGVAQEMAEKRRLEVEARDKNKKSNEENDTRGRKYPLKKDDGGSVDHKLKKGVRDIRAMANPFGIMQQMGKEGDGIYFMVFVLSVVADVLTLGVGAVQAIPLVGWILGLVMGVPTEMWIIGTQAVIVLLYIINGHYKERKVAMKVAVTMGFGFLELIPIATALPGFVGSFLINYTLVLQGRVAKEMLKKNKGSVIIINKNRRSIF